MTYDDQVDAMTQALVRLGKAQPKLDYSWGHPH